MKSQGSQQNAKKRGNDSGLNFGILWSLVGCNGKPARISTLHDFDLSNGLLRGMFVRPPISQTSPCYGAPA